MSRGQVSSAAIISGVTGESCHPATNRDVMTALLPFTQTGDATLRSDEPSESVTGGWCSAIISQMCHAIFPKEYADIRAKAAYQVAAFDAMLR